MEKRHFHLGYLIAVPVLAVLAFFITLLLFPEWSQSWRLLVVLAVMTITGATGFLANLRQAIEGHNPSPLTLPVQNSQTQQRNIKNQGVYIEGDANTSGGPIVGGNQINITFPSSGDSFNKIHAQFALHTDRTLRSISIHIPGLGEPLPRIEVANIEEQLAAGQHVVLTGSAGTGKSGIGAILASNARQAGKTVLLVDARRLGSLNNDVGLRDYFDLSDSFTSAVRCAGAHKGCRVIVDQLDNIAGSAAAILLADNAVECIQGKQVTEWVIICRNENPNERQLLTKLLSNGFSELISYPIGREIVKDVLAYLGIYNPPTELIEIGCNLLNLELIGKIREQQPSFDFSTLIDEPYLWERFVQVLCNREGDTSGTRLIAEAVKMAQQGLRHPEGNFLIEYPPSAELNRLTSWGIVSPVDGRWYRFRHEEFQDYIYAWDAAERQAMPQDVLNEIITYKSRNIFKWMDLMYQRRNSPVRKQFLRGILNVAQ